MCTTDVRSFASIVQELGEIAACRQGRLALYEAVVKLFNENVEVEGVFDTDRVCDDVVWIMDRNDDGITSQAVLEKVAKMYNPEEVYQDGELDDWAEREGWSK